MPVEKVFFSSHDGRTSVHHHRSQRALFASLAVVAFLCATQTALAQCYTFEGTTPSGGTASLSVNITSLPQPMIDSLPGFIAYEYNLTGLGGNTASLTIDDAVYSSTAFQQFDIQTVDQSSVSQSGFALILQSSPGPSLSADIILANAAGNLFPNGLTAVLPAASQWPLISFTVSPPGGPGQTITLTSISSACSQSTGNLVQVSAGADGTAWGVNSFDAIYRWDSQSRTWQNVPGALIQIAVGGSGHVWGLNPANEIYRFDPSTQSWVQVPGYLSQIAVGADGDTWGINSGQQIYHFDPAGQVWVEIPGSLSQISVGSASAVWGLNSAGNVFDFDAGTGYFEQIPGVLKQISVGADGDVWGVNPADQIYYLNRQLQAWAQVAGSLSQISVNSASNVWGVNSLGGAYTFNSQTQTWSQVAGEFKQVTAGASGTAWGLDSANNVYQLVAPH